MLKSCGSLGEDLSRRVYSVSISISPRASWPCRPIHPLYISINSQLDRDKDRDKTHMGHKNLHRQVWMTGHPSLPLRSPRHRRQTNRNRIVRQRRVYGKGHYILVNPSWEVLAGTYHGQSVRFGSRRGISRLSNYAITVPGRSLPCPRRSSPTRSSCLTTTLVLTG